MKPETHATRKPGAGDRPPSFWQSLGSVVAAFFGIQSSRNRVRDFTHGRPQVFIVAGLVVTLLFILSVWLAVKLALKSAGA